MHFLAENYYALEFFLYSVICYCIVLLKIYIFFAHLVTVSSSGLELLTPESIDQEREPQTYNHFRV